MERWRGVGEALERHLRLGAFPVAVRFLAPGEALPEKARRPLVALETPIAVCQALTLARRMGWTIALGPDDSSCPLFNLAMGWLEEFDPSFMHAFFTAMQYAKDEEAARARVQGLGMLDPGECAVMVLSPLTRTQVVPHLVMVFGNPAQVMRLVQATTRWEGKRVAGSFGGLGGSCNEGLILTRLEEQPRVVLPGNGDRVFAATQDHEMAFAFPGDWSDRIIEGLEATAARGVRYPIPTNLQYELPFMRLMARFSTYVPDPRD
jgi:uncharacterized protein (DUF169 family)